MVAAILGRMNRRSSKKQKLRYADQESLVGDEGFRLSICYGRKGYEDLLSGTAAWRKYQREAERR